MRIKNTVIRFDFSFFAVLAFLLLLDTGGTAMLSIIACILHECGHLCAMALCSQAPDTITFYGGGISIGNSLEAVPIGKRIIILSAGCIVNLLLFSVGYAFFSDNPQISVFAAVNLLICLFNLLPIGYFDGAQLMSALLERLLPYEKAMLLQRIIGTVMSLLMLGGVAAYCILSHNTVSVSLGFAVLYLLLAQFV